jgi:hypothetical protein
MSFCEMRPNGLMVSDVTSISTFFRFLYLSVQFHLAYAPSVHKCQKIIGRRFFFIRPGAYVVVFVVIMGRKGDNFRTMYI